MPALGMAQESGILVNWLKAEGETVSKGEPLMEVETDKATVEIEAPASGILAHVTAAPGDKVPVGTTIAVIAAPGESVVRLVERPSVAPRFAEKTEAQQKMAQPTDPSVLTATGRLLASPAARRIAREHGIELTQVKGAGPQGSVVAEDVLRVLQEQAPATAERGITISPVPLTTMRRVVGERMALSKQTAPHFYVSLDVDMTEAERQRAKRKEQGTKIVPSVNDLILWASARALRDFPTLNSTLTDQGVEIYPHVNLGMAVALEEGLVVPVIQSADRLTLDEIAQQSRELADKAQKKKLFPLDCEGGTFTVSNLGMLGVDSFIAIINPPQCAILAVGQVAPRVVPHGEGIAIRSMMAMTLSADHRIVDGVVAARFLLEVKGFLQNPKI
jgi:pyruvate dehydrogenase E2 component (dihydrolipoyllysine-residue acetyltransferase)